MEAKSWKFLCLSCHPTLPYKQDKKYLRGSEDIYMESSRLLQSTQNKTNTPAMDGIDKTRMQTLQCRHESYFLQSHQHHHQSRQFNSTQQSRPYRIMMNKNRHRSNKLRFWWRWCKSNSAQRHTSFNSRLLVDSSGSFLLLYVRFAGAIMLVAHAIDLLLHVRKQGVHIRVGIDADRLDALSTHRLGTRHFDGSS